MLVIIKNKWQQIFGMLMKDLAGLWHQIFCLFIQAVFKLTRILFTHVVDVALLLVPIIEHPSDVVVKLPL